MGVPNYFIYATNVLKQKDFLSEGKNVTKDVNFI